MADRGQRRKCVSCGSEFSPVDESEVCPNCNVSVSGYDKETERIITIQPGREWHSKALQFSLGTMVTLSARANNKFYCGLFAREDYFHRVGAAGGAFAFQAGTDRPGFTTREKILADDDYYIVFRVSVWGGPTTINFRLKVDKHPLRF